MDNGSHINLDFGKLNPGEKLERNAEDADQRRVHPHMSAFQFGLRPNSAATFESRLKSCHAAKESKDWGTETILFVLVVTIFVTYL